MVNTIIKYSLSRIIKLSNRSLIQTTCYFILKLIGWNIDYQPPASLKYVLVGFDHTSNWDFIIIILIMTALGLKYRFIGKDSLFRNPAGILFRKLGGIPVDRTKRNNLVDQMIELFQKSKDMILMIAPEGTRKKTNYIKTGFYYIATGAQIPIAFGYLDYLKKTGGIGGWFIPCGNIDADLKPIRNFYSTKTPRFPKNKSSIQLKPLK